jgi:hypothetical protein
MSRVVGMRGLVAGTLVASSLVGYQVLSNYGAIERDGLYWGVMVVPVVFGGAVSGFLVERYIRYVFSRRGSVWGAVIGSVLVSPFALHYGVLLGTLGGGLGETLGERLGVGEAGVYGGVGLSVVTTIVVIEPVGAAVGGSIGSLTESAIGWVKHRISPERR